MSYQATEYVDGLRLGGNPVVKHVAGVLAHHHDSRNGRIRMYVEEIVESSELSERTVRRALKTLEGMGELKTLVKGNRSVQSLFELTNLQKAVTESGIPVTVTETPVTESGTPVTVTAETGAIRKEVEVKRVEENLNQHSFAGLNARIRTWLTVKAQLKTKLPIEEWNLWLRPAFLLRVMDQGRFFLLSLPANDRIMKTATANKTILIEILQSHGCTGCSFTRYPDEYELERLCNEYPDFYEQLPEALKKRRPEKVSA